MCSQDQTILLSFLFAMSSMIYVLPPISSSVLSSYASSSSVTTAYPSLSKTKLCHRVGCACFLPFFKPKHCTGCWKHRRDRRFKSMGWPIEIPGMSYIYGLTLELLSHSFLRIFSKHFFPYHRM